MSVTVAVSLPGLRRYQSDIKPNLQVVYTQWAVRYRSFIQRRFDRYSKGSGDWAPLKIRKGSILRDTNTLFTALAPSITPPEGSINTFLPDGIEVGFGGPASHPGGPTIHQIAVWHQSGAGNYPAREMIVAPDDQTVKGMVSDMQRAMTPK